MNMLEKFIAEIKPANDLEKPELVFEAGTPLKESCVALFPKNSLGESCLALYPKY